MSDIEDWITFFKDEDDEEKQSIVSEILSRKESIKMAKKVLEEITADEHMREKIEAIENFQLDQRSRMYAARLEGKEEGRAEGAYRDKLEVARALLLENAEIDFVMKITKLEKSVVEAILHEIGNKS